ncbi:MAG: hypothetical protein H6712_35120 [Myxococcales bacterium]|nr:hypothetical protein [Myxococcales bacterium]MCB9719130.1 hypothetical protein [Myxococcales bacterium]
MRGTITYVGIAALVSAGGCILEPNPAFQESAAASSSATEGTGPDATGDGPSSGPTSGVDGTDTGATDGDTDGDPYQAGCDDPQRCTTYHIGLVEDSCPHQVDGVELSTCDFVGQFGLRIAAATLEYEGEGGLLVLHDNNGVTASYVGSVDIVGGTTVRAAEGLSPSSVRVFSQDTAGVLRLRGDGVHLHGFTVACRAGGEHAITVREDLEVQGTETGGHLVENLVMIATRPEDVGSNSIVPFFQSVGRQTVIRNNHVWGYFENALDMRFATDSVLSHNTVLYYQELGSTAAIDATQVDGLEISNNVFVSLTNPIEAFVAADDTTEGLTLVGNAVEGFGVVLGGLEPTAPGVTVADNTLGALPLESPRSPLVLVDGDLPASAAGQAWGTSLDGMPLSGLAGRLPGAFQQRSALALPRRSVITVGEGSCGGQPCDVTKSFDNELQRAAWTAWPGATIEIQPSASPYAGPVVISWPVTLRGAGSQPDEVVIRRQLEDSVLTNDGMWWGKETVIDLTESMGEPSVVEMLTVEAGTDETGIFHEGRGSASLVGRHEIRRVILRDDGSVAGAPADQALLIGDDVVVHDVLIHGGYDTCVTFGPRSWSGSPTPSTTAWVHHLSCRLTEPEIGTQPIAAFGVASVADVVIADVVVELVEPGPLFRAQRRSSGDNDPLVALDPPLDFVAHSISARGQGSLFEGFTALDGSYALTDVDELGVMELLFVGPSDSHLAAGALGIDAGVDPATLEPGLQVGVAVDGVDRGGHVPDRGAYEQGL